MLELVSDKFTSDHSCSFSGCGLTSEGAACLGKMLEKNRHLTSLGYEDRLFILSDELPNDLLRSSKVFHLKRLVMKVWLILLVHWKRTGHWLNWSKHTTQFNAHQCIVMWILIIYVNMFFIIIVLVMWGWHLLVCGDYPFTCHAIHGLNSWGKIFSRIARLMMAFMVQTWPQWFWPKGLSAYCKTH